MIPVPRSVAADVPVVADLLTDRMHELLERNTDGALNEVERAELDLLVRVTQITQVLSVALKAAT